MNRQETFRIRSRNFLEDKTSGTMLGILCVFVPFGIVGFLGESLGNGTSLSNAVIFLAYVLTIGIASLVMKTWGWNWRGLGLGRPADTRRTMLQAISTLLAAVGAVVLPQIIVLLLVGPSGPASDQSEYNPLAGNLPLLVMSVLAALTYITFGEEMVFRGFLLNALSRPFRQTRANAAMAVVGSSMIFGLAHFAWGWMGVLEATLFGLVLGAAYVRSGRNLWVTKIAHGLANTMKFLLIYGGAV